MRKLTPLTSGGSFDRYYEGLLENCIQPVKDAGFEALGCAGAFCSGSPLMEMVRDKSLEEAEQMTEEDIISFLRGIPEQKFHCTCLARKTLELAIRKFRNIETSSRTD